MPVILSPGQTADRTAAETVPADIDAGATLIADRADDNNAIFDHLADAGATPVVPCISNRANPGMRNPAACAMRNRLAR